VGQEVYKEKKGSSTIYYDILDKFKFDTCKYLSQRALGYSLIFGILTPGLPAFDQFVLRDKPAIVINYEANIAKKDSLVKLMSSPSQKREDIQNQLAGIESKISEDFLEYTSYKHRKKKDLMNASTLGLVSFLIFYIASYGLDTRKYDHVKFKYIETANGLRIDENGNTLT
jgi:hypothetical protein